MPGEGLIDLDKYGLGKDIDYKVETDPATKLEYTVSVRKAETVNCSIQNRPIATAGSFKFYRTWLNIMVVQLTSDYNLKYFLCELTPGPSCSYSIEIPNMGPIDDSAY